MRAVAKADAPANGDDKKERKPRVRKQGMSLNKQMSRLAYLARKSQAGKDLTEARGMPGVTAVVLTYPLQFFPAMVALEDKLGLSDESGLLPCCAARTCLVLAAFAVARALPEELGPAGWHSLVLTLLSLQQLGLCPAPLAPTQPVMGATDASRPGRSSAVARIA